LFQLRLRHESDRLEPIDGRKRFVIEQMPVASVTMRPRSATTEQILAAADRVARRDGIERLTIRRLCAELGVTAPTVYGHFSSKDEIVDQLVDRILGGVVHPGTEFGNWVDRLRGFIVSIYDQVAPYPGLAARIAEHLPRLPASKRNAAFLREMVDLSGLCEGDAADLASVLFLYTWGHLVGAQSGWLVGGPARVSRSLAMHRFLWGLDRLLDSFRPDMPVSTDSGLWKRATSAVD
jgi:AcrR family transcriptional regulator